MPTTGLVADSSVKKHVPGVQHPEQPARFDAVLNGLESTGLSSKLTPITARSATTEEACLAHERSYVELAEREIITGSPQLSTGDTDVCRDSWQAALVASGSVLSAVDCVFAKQVTNAFCVVRPPGHHASANRGMGFCILNNVAVGAKYAQKRHNVERVLVIDWDVHHGNGTQDIFYQDGSVLFFSTHQSPWYPGTGRASERGAGQGVGMTINCPLPAGTDGTRVLQCFREQLVPAAELFSPDLIFLSAGFDSRAGDPLGGFLLEDDDFATMTHMAADLATRFCSDRLISVLEGGYSLEGLAAASTAHVGALIR